MKTFILLIAILISKNNISYSSHQLSCKNSKLTPGKKFTCICEVDQTQAGSGRAIWLKSQGQIRLIIGQEYLKDYDFHQDRYKFSLLHSNNPQISSYKLEISPVKFEDSGTFYCISPVSKIFENSNTHTLAVCDDVNSTFCQCSLENKWATPKCAKIILTDKEEDGARRACIGLGTVLAITILLAIILTIWVFCRDVNRCIENRRDKKLKQSQQREQPTISNSVPSKSILKSSKLTFETDVKKKDQISKEIQMVTDSQNLPTKLYPNLYSNEIEDTDDSNSINNSSENKKQVVNNNIVYNYNGRIQNNIYNNNQNSYTNYTFDNNSSTSRGTEI